MASPTARPYPFIRVAGPVALVLAPMIAAAFSMWEVSLLVRQAALCVWGVGATLAFERLLFNKTIGTAVRSVGFVPVPRPTLVMAVLAGLPMWLFLPAFAWLSGVPFEARADWLSIIVGVVLVNGITEESASIFAAQHGYLVASAGWTPGLASIVLAGLVIFHEPRAAHMGVVLVSLYLVFASRRFPVATSEVAAGELSVG